MVNEKIDTTQNIITPPVWDHEKEEDLLAALESIPEEDIMRMWAKMDDTERKREEEEMKSWEVPQELKDYRRARWQKIWLDAEIKEKIVKAAEKIPLNVEQDSDWSRLIEFKLGNKRYKILDPMLGNHTDDEFRHHRDYRSIKHVNKDAVKLKWMWWDKIYRWKNQKLKEYVKQKKKEWLHIVKIEEIKNLVVELCKEAKLENKKHGIAMLMYLTGMDWWYWLSMWNYKTSWGNKSRSALKCWCDDRWFSYCNHANARASLCMISCK